MATTVGAPGAGSTRGQQPGVLNATQIAGPAAIISWVVGASAVMLLALIHAMESGADELEQEGAPAPV